MLTIGFGILYRGFVMVPAKAPLGDPCPAGLSEILALPLL